jgi:hypothetical protein
MDTTKALHNWTDKELAERLRDYPSGIDPLHGANLGAEIERRRNLRNGRYALASVMIAAIAAVASMVAAIASWVTVYMKLG